MVAAGPFYWRYVHPEQHRFDFADATRLATFAAAHSLPLRGHTLVWHDLMPAWAFRNRDWRDARGVLSEHVSGIVSHFRGRVKSWDVVNEPLQLTDGHPDGLRRSRFLQAMGADYIAIALQSAHAAGGQARLGINEFGLESDSESSQRKRTAMLGLLRRLKERLVPIDYLGLQAHLSGGDRFSSNGLGAFIAEVRSLGIRVLVTELDVNDSMFPARTDERDALVADVYERFLRIALASGEVDSVTTWGLSDDRSWLQWFRPRPDGLPQRPLPFDAMMNPKPAWDVLQRHLEVA
jgi:endo-1,4-beta-xylanase